MWISVVQRVLSRRTEKLNIQWRRTLGGEEEGGTRKEAIFDSNSGPALISMSAPPRGNKLPSRLFGHPTTSGFTEKSPPNLRSAINEDGNATGAFIENPPISGPHKS